MASNINPNNIDGTYPVAGQDNDSQGFRDNFTNAKTNFEYAQAEITDLQSKVILKSALSGTVLNNNMGGSLLENAELRDMSETHVQVVPESGTGEAEIDYSEGPYQTITTNGSVTLSFTNFPETGTLGRLRLQIDVTDITHTLTLPSAVSIGTESIQGFESGVITFNKIGKYEFEFESVSNGSTISILDHSRNPDPLYLPGSEDLNSGSSVSLQKTSSYFSTVAAETATLAAGSEGQVKVLAMYADNGNMVITVENAGWKSSGNGTITFANIGDACTLMYINAKWFCVGNNGATFG